jgi:hypothetical protein
VGSHTHKHLVGELEAALRSTEQHLWLHAMRLPEKPRRGLGREASATLVI